MACTRSSLAWSDISVGIFDQRWNGKSTTALLAICLSASQTLIVLSLRRKEGKVFTEPPHARLPAISVAPVRALRSNVYDLLVVKPNRTLAILTHGMHEIPIRIRSSVEPKVADNGVLSLKDSVNSSVSLTFADRSIARISINLIPDELLTKQCLFMLSMMLPAQFFFDLHHRFLLKWSLRGYSSIDDDTFNSFKDAVFEILSIPNPSSKLDTNSWNNLCMTSSLTRYDDDPAFRRLKLPPSLRTMPAKISYKPHEHTGVVLHGLHYVGLNLWLNVRRHRDLLKLATVVCKLAIVVRPEWADFWKRISPDALDYWPSSADSSTYIHLCYMLHHADKMGQLPVTWTSDCLPGLPTYSPAFITESTTQTGVNLGSLPSNMQHSSTSLPPWRLARESRYSILVISCRYSLRWPMAKYRTLGRELRTPYSSWPNCSLCEVDKNCSRTYRLGWLHH